MLRGELVRQGVVAMNRSILLLKLAAVASSVLLLAAFVSYRAGAFSRLMESPASPVRTMMPSTKLHTIKLAPSAETPAAQPPAPPQELPSKATERTRTLLPGSKSEERLIAIQGPEQ
jgi:hypothetical protein